MHNHDICYFNSTIFQRANIMHTDNSIIMLLADLLAKHRRVQYFFTSNEEEFSFCFVGGKFQNSLDLLKSM